MIIAVLGASGQLGSDLIHESSAEPCRTELLALHRKDLDVRDLPSIPVALSKYRFDVLVNCTGYHKTDEVEEHPTEAFRINAHAVGALAKACKAQHARFVHISTDYVFDGHSSHPYKETDHASPLNVYGASKLLGERLALREYENSTLIVRVASLFGVAGSSGKGSNFVETILRKAKETGEIRVVDDISMSPTSTVSVARVILALLQKGAPEGIYHVVNSGSATWFEFAQQIVQQAEVLAKVIPVSSDEYPTVAIRPAFTVLDNQKVSRVVGEIPGWKDALRDYLIEKRHVPEQFHSSGRSGF